ncbi:MAG TPA: TrkA family potassium uptake protein [Egibacteraceae bacterium]|nr:TrkA family potassium uptake protein [Egibacteraceae bacterium]
MHVVIGGCGRVGSQLATVLSAQGHDVAVIDKSAAAFRRLGEDFSGQTVQGFCFDRSALEEAGIRRAQAYVAVTSGDNSNVVSARAARDYYGIGKVVARIYDPERAPIYERLGVRTIASARWTAEQVLRTLLPEGERVDDVEIGPGPGEVVMITLTLPPGVHGLDAAELHEPGAVVLAAITREHATRVPAAGALLEAGDQVHLVVDRGSVERVRERVARLRGHHG